MANGSPHGIVTDLPLSLADQIRPTGNFQRAPPDSLTRYLP